MEITNADYLPDEIWVEILSKLPIKSLFNCRLVCKPWRKLFTSVGTKIDTNPSLVPVCGLFIISLAEARNFTYVCLRTRKSFVTRFDSPENNLICSSGFERGILSDLSFDFSVMYKFSDYGRDDYYVNWFLNEGLVMVYDQKEGMSEVHNPATKKKYLVPSTSIMGYHKICEVPGYLISFPSFFSKQRFTFLVIRFCLQLRVMEMYSSRTCTWSKYRLTVDDEVMSDSSHWSTPNLVARVEKGPLCLYVLTNKDVGVAIRMNSRSSMVFETIQYCFPLPKVTHGKGDWNTRLWLCEKSLYLSYYNVTGLWIWKAGCTLADSWSWVSVLEISSSSAGKEGNSLADESLSKMVLDDECEVMPLAFQPDAPVVYLLAQSSIFAYNLNAATLDRIVILAGDPKTECFATIFRPLLRYMDGCYLAS